MVKIALATIDRPLFYTLHGIVSKTQGGTIGTAPWNESTKRMRTVAGALKREKFPGLDERHGNIMGNTLHSNCLK